MSKVNIANQMLREQFTEALAEEFQKRFETEIETTWSIIGMNYVTVRADDEPLTTEQHYFINGFEAAWLRASNIVAEEA